MSNTLSHTTMIGNTLIDVAPLEVIDYARLVHNDPAEIEKLLGCAKLSGFFLLDLRGASTKSYIENVNALCGVADEYFSQPEEVKMKDFRPLEDRSYKPSATDSSFEAGLSPRVGIARDEMIGGELKLPAILQKHAKLLEDFTEVSNSICQILLAILSDALGLNGTARFGNSHRDGELSDSGLKLVYEPALDTVAEVVDGVHTDRGTFTILFCDQWGTQVEMPDTKIWGFIEPKPGHAIINVADSLASLSGKRFHSCLHRVTQPVDGFEKRFLVIYFMRPENAIKF